MLEMPILNGAKAGENFQRGYQKIIFENYLS
jgi:hypothetical protein